MPPPSTLLTLILLTLSILFAFTATICVFLFIFLVLQNLWALRHSWEMVYRVPWLAWHYITTRAQRRMFDVLVDGQVSEQGYWRSAGDERTKNWELRRLRVMVIGGALAMVGMVLGRALKRRWREGTNAVDKDEESRVWMLKLDEKNSGEAMTLRDPALQWRKKRA